MWTSGFVVSSVGMSEVKSGFCIDMLYCTILKFLPQRYQENDGSNIRFVRWAMVSRSSLT